MPMLTLLSALGLNGGTVALGPGPVDVSTQGTVRTANSDATIVSQIAASSAGDTVVISAGTYGYLTTTKSIPSGFIRIVPAAGATVTCAGVDMTSAQGLDWRGINTTGTSNYNNWWQNSTRCRWRGGTHTMSSSTMTAFTVRQGCTDIVVEDVTVTNAAISFLVQAFTEATRSTNVVFQRFRSNNVAQDHVFLSRGSEVVVQDFEMFGHTESAEHQDGVQIVGIKNAVIRRGRIWNTRTFRDGATDQNDHGVIVNYDDAETPDGRVPENITVENLLIHDQTSQGISIAGVLGMTVRNCTVYDCGPSGGASALSVQPDTGNTISGLVIANNVLSSWFSSGTIGYTTNTHNFVADLTGPAGTSRLTGSPGFTNSGAQDYTLAAGSQLAGSGSLPDAPAVDAYSSTRSGSTASRGAIEPAVTAVEVTATATAPLGALTSTATAVREVGASATAPLGALTSVATAVRDTAGSAVSGLGGLASSATADRSVTATAAAPLGALSSTAAADRAVTAAATGPLGALTSTATADRSIVATAQAALGPLTSSAGSGAVRFDAATDRVSYVGAVPPPATGLTITAWVYVAVDTNTYATIARIWAAGEATVATWATDIDGVSGPSYFTGGGTVTNATGLAVGQWRKVALTCSGTTGRVFVAPPAGATEVDSGTVSVGTPAGITLGGRGPSDATESFNGRLAHVRVWSAELSQTQIETEWGSVAPALTSGLWADWPLTTHADLTDHSGNGRHLTAGSTSTSTEDGPPVGASSTVEGAASAPLGALTSTAVGSRAVAAVASAVLGGLSSSTVASRETAATGASPLGVLTSTAAGVRVVGVAASASLGVLSSSAAGERVVGGNTVAPLGALVSATSATRIVAAQAAATLGALVSAASGSAVNDTAAAGPLGGLASVSTAERTATAAAAAALGPLSSTAAADITVTGAASGSLGGLASGAVATRLVLGQASSPLGALVSTGQATRTVEVVVAAPLGGLVSTSAAGRTVQAQAVAPLGAVVSSGGAVRELTAAAVAPLGSLGSVAAGSRGVDGAAIAPLGGLASMATGEGVGPTAALGFAPLGPLTSTATAERAITGAGAAPLGPLTSTAAASRTGSATAAAPLGALTSTTAAVRDGGAVAGAELGPLTTLAVTAREVAAQAFAVLGGLVSSSAAEAGPVSASGPLGALVSVAALQRIAEAQASAMLGSLLSTAGGARAVSGAASAPLGGLVSAGSDGAALAGWPPLVSGPFTDPAVVVSGPYRDPVVLVSGPFSEPLVLAALP